jgi:hypothetical protein
MENLKELSLCETSKINGGIVWVPLLIKGAKLIAAGVAGGTAAYVGHEVTDGVVRGIAGGEYVPCK